MLAKDEEADEDEETSTIGIGYLKCDEVIEGLTGKGWDTRDEEMYKVKGVQLEQPMLF